MGGYHYLEYGFAANELAFGGSLLMIAGGVLGILPFEGYSTNLSFFRIYWASVYSLLVGIIILLIEIPRGMRKKGSVVERRFQSWFLRWSILKIRLTGNYFLRSVFYFLLSVPSCFLITTVLGGVILLIASIVYFVAALKGERWTSPMASGSADAGQNHIKEAPSNPPPRRPDH